MKTNWIKRILSFFRRKNSDEHVAEVVVYVDGKVIEAKSCTFVEEYGKSASYCALAFANGIVSNSYGMERRRMKGRA